MRLKANGGRPPFAVETMRGIHFMQQWFTLSDPAREEALHDMPLFRDFAGLNWETRLPDETKILRFRRLLEKHKLAPQILVVVNELLGAKGLLLRTGPVVDAESGLVHTVRGTTGSVNDVVEANALLHGKETEAWGDAGYQGVDRRADANDSARWNIAMRPGKRKQLDKTNLVEQLTDQLERIKASIRAKVEHPLRVIKRQLGHVKVRYRGLKKNTAQLHTLFALSNLWMARRSLVESPA
jgi:IS5 family transposase